MMKMPRQSQGMTRAAGSESGGIALHRETLRGLEGTALERVAAGATYYCHSGAYHSACSNC